MNGSSPHQPKDRSSLGQNSHALSLSSPIRNPGNQIRRPRPVPEAYCRLRIITGQDENHKNRKNRKNRKKRQCETWNSPQCPIPGKVAIHYTLRYNIGQGSVTDQTYRFETKSMLAWRSGVKPATVWVKDGGRYSPKQGDKWEAITFILCHHYHYHYHWQWHWQWQWQWHNPGIFKGST